MCGPAVWLSIRSVGEAQDFEGRVDMLTHQRSSEVQINKLERLVWFARTYTLLCRCKLVGLSCITCSCQRVLFDTRKISCHLRYKAGPHSAITLVSEFTLLTPCKKFRWSRWNHNYGVSANMLYNKNQFKLTTSIERIGRESSYSK